MVFSVVFSQRTDWRQEAGGVRKQLQLGSNVDIAFFECSVTLQNM